MIRPIRATLALALAAIALALPTAALAAREAGRAPTARAVTVPSSALVTGYAGGQLTLSLNAGATVTGAVTAQTRIVCPRVTLPAPRRGTPPPPCDASLLVPGEGVYAASMTLTATGVAFQWLVVLPPVPPAPSGG